MAQQVLLIDPDPGRRAVREAVLRYAGFGVRSTDDVMRAVGEVTAHRPDLVLVETPLRPPGERPLLEQLSLDEEGGPLTVVMLVDDAASGPALLAVGATEVWTRPVGPGELTARIHLVLLHEARVRAHRAEAATRLEVGLDRMGLLDLLEVIGQRAAHIQCEPAQAGAERVTGDLWVRDGQVLDCIVGRHTGPDAFFRLLTWPGGRAQAILGPHRRPRSIERPTPELLVEGLRRMDAWRTLSGRLDGGRLPVSVDLEALQARRSEQSLEDALQASVDVVLQWGDRAASAHALCDLAPGDPLSTLERLVALLEAGLLRVGRDPESPPSLSASSEGLALRGYPLAGVVVDVRRGPADLTQPHFELPGDVTQPGFLGQMHDPTHPRAPRLQMGAALPVPVPVAAMPADATEPRVILPPTLSADPEKTPPRHETLPSGRAVAAQDRTDPRIASLGEGSAPTVPWESSPPPVASDPQTATSPGALPVVSRRVSSSVPAPRPVPLIHPPPVLRPAPVASPVVEASSALPPATRGSLAESATEDRPPLEVRPRRPVAQLPEQEESSIVVAPEVFVPNPQLPPPVVSGWSSGSGDVSARTALPLPVSLSAPGAAALDVLPAPGWVGRWGWGALAAAGAAFAALALLAAVWFSSGRSP